MKILTGIVSLSLFGVIALWLLLPERYAINLPLGLNAAVDSELERIQVPEHYQFNVYADGLPGVRVLRVTARGDLIASQPKSGRVLLLRKDQNGDGRADDVEILLDGLNRPHGLALHQGWLYVAESDTVLRIRFDESSGQVSRPHETIIRNEFPGDGGHWTRTLGIGPDEHLYVSVGSSCNVCEESHPARAAMLRFRLNGSGGEVYAKGLRNTVGFDWHPISGDLYGTDNGRDLLGDDFPPCELNRIEPGRHYGWPYANGMNVPDPDFGDRNPDLARSSTPPVHSFAAHNAPLGIRFLATPLRSGAQATALVALHGSWNRSVKDGYKVVALDFEPNGKIVESDFMTGFEHKGDVIGRPVDITQNTQGELFISDDFSGRIFRISRKLP